MAKVAPTVELSDGTQMPVLALGTLTFSTKDTYDAVKIAIDIGYRHFDTAWRYNTEKEVGEAIRDKIADGTIKREDVFVTTKLWTTCFENVIPSCKESLENLGLDYIDAYLIHWPIAMKHSEKSENVMANLVADDELDFLEPYKQMEECVRLGYVRSLGVSNFNSEQIERLLAVATIKPVVNQVECSVTLNQKKLTAFCKERGIVVTGFCPLGRPNPTEKTPVYFYSDEMEAITKKYGKTPAQVTLRYLIDIGTVPLPKSYNPTRMQENFDIFDFKLTQDEIESLDKFNTNVRIVAWDVFKDAKNYPFNIEF